jgi:tRNA threonylcarbamoyladenosine biosynthesis protein TsaE
MAHKFTIKSLEELDKLSREIIEISLDTRVFIFKGDLGAGKTTLIQKMVKNLGCDEKVSSPTFSIINVYSGPIYHFDLYRINDVEELEEIGFFEYLDSGHYCFIEWPELIEDYLDFPYLEINISINENNTRNVLIL